MGEHIPLVVDIIHCPKSIEEPRRHKKKTCHWVWTLSAAGQVKVNMDNYFLGGFGRGYWDCD